jgi:hypothetical protein
VKFMCVPDKEGFLSGRSDLVKALSAREAAPHIVEWRVL